MNPEVKNRWVAALRSGNYNQGSGALRDINNGFCCLGVLCDLAVQDGIIPGPTRGDMKYRYDGNTEYPTSAVVVWADLPTENPAVLHMIPNDNEYYDYDEDEYEEEWPSEVEVECTLAEINDDHYTFGYIADLIEAQL